MAVYGFVRAQIRNVATRHLRHGTSRLQYQVGVCNAIALQSSIPFYTFVLVVVNFMAASIAPLLRISANIVSEMRWDCRKHVCFGS